jgi:hypothetical protein
MNPKLENLVEYISVSNPRGVNKLAYEYGFIPPVSTEGRKGFLFTGLMEEGEDFFKGIAKIHPDRDLIMNADGLNPNEPNIIDLRNPSVTETVKVIKDNSSLINIAILAILVLIAYKVWS